MRTWKELSHKEQCKVFKSELSDTLKSITEAPEAYPGLEKEIDKASIESERMRTPWFFTEILYHEQGCKLKIQKITLQYLHIALFRTTIDPVIITL